MAGKILYSRYITNFHPNFAIIGQKVRNCILMLFKSQNQVYYPDFMCLRFSQGTKYSDSIKIAYKFQSFLTKQQNSYINYRYLLTYLFFSLINKNFKYHLFYTEGVLLLTVVFLLSNFIF
jgi:hypothetical protein